MLAEACRVGTSRPAHRVSAEQRQVRRQLRVRDLLVRARGRTISLMRALVRSEGLRVRAGDADRFGTYVQELTLPAELATALRPLLAAGDRRKKVAERFARLDPAVQRLAQRDPEHFGGDWGAYFGAAMVPRGSILAFFDDWREEEECIVDPADLRSLRITRLDTRAPTGCETGPSGRSMK